MIKMKPNNKYFVTIILITLFIPIFLTACSNKPIPEGKINYVGHWRGKFMYLSILQDGSFKYYRFKKGWKTSITGLIKNFEGDHFIVGFIFFTTTFEVSKPPYKVDGVWKMEVDGVTLTKTQ